MTVEAEMKIQLVGEAGDEGLTTRIFSRGGEPRGG